MPTIVFCIILVLFTTQVGNLFGTSASWCALIAGFYLFIPVAIYFSRKMRSPMQADMEPVDPFGSALPVAQRKLYYELHQEMCAAGFIEIGCVRGGNTPGNSLVAIFQHQTTTDIAQLILLNRPENVTTPNSGCLEISRERNDQSKLITKVSKLRSIRPPSPKDSVHRVVGALEFKNLWALHGKRVAEDPTVVDNPPVHDAKEFQDHEEKQGAMERLESGNWRVCEGGKMMRPTLKGAYKMVWRMLPPFSFYFAWRDNRAGNDLRNS